MTQLPLPDTLAEFWTLVEEQDVRTIVSLGSQKDSDKVKVRESVPEFILLTVMICYEIYVNNTDIAVSAKNCLKLLSHC